MSAQELRDALSGPRGALDMYLECNDEKQVRADILALTGDEERRKFAAMAMQGLCANGPFAEATANHPQGIEYVRQALAEASVAVADHLLATLQRPQRGEGE